MLRTALSVALLAYTFVQLQDENWWLYVPMTWLSVAVNMWTSPASGVWRFATSVVTTIGGLLTAFLLWTLLAIQQLPTLQLVEAHNLLPLAIGVLMTSYLRLTTDDVKRPIHFVRTSLVLASGVVALGAIIFSADQLMRI